MSKEIKNFIEWAIAIAIYPLYFVLDKFNRDFLGGDKDVRKKKKTAR